MILRISILLCVALLLLATAAFLRPGPFVEWFDDRSPRVRFDADVEQPLVAVTIDDGPSESTEAILEALAVHDARATFFLIGDRVLEHAAATREVVERGHEIGHHMWRDETSVLLDEARFERRFSWTERVLEPYAPDLRWFRPAGGLYDEEMIERVERAGYRLVLGSIPPIDTFVSSPGIVARHLRANTRPGAILVIHDGPERGARAAQTLRALLPGLEAEGYRAVTLSELVSAEAAIR